MNSDRTGKRAAVIQDMSRQLIIPGTAAARAPPVNKQHVVASDDDAQQPIGALAEAGLSTTGTACAERLARIALR